MSELICNDKVKTRHFHATKRFIKLFIDDLGTLNEGDVFNNAYKVTKTSIPLNYN